MEKNSNKSTKVTKDSKALASFLNDSFSKNEKTVAIDKIMDSCFVTRQVVYNWMYGHCRIPELYKRKIEEIFSTEIFCEMENA